MLGFSEEGAGKQHGRFQPDAQGLGQLAGVALRQGGNARQYPGVVDQGGAAKVVERLALQPFAQSRCGACAVGQVLLPLQQRATDSVGRVLQGGRFAARNAQQGVGGLEELLRHREAHATRSAGEDGQMSAHANMVLAQLFAR